MLSPKVIFLKFHFVVNGFNAVGIHVTMRPMERAPFYAAWRLVPPVTEVCGERRDIKRSRLWEPGAGDFMIMGSFGRYTVETAHDHESASWKGSRG